jgi:hypothetical protein
VNDKQVGLILREAWQRREQRDETTYQHGQTESKDKAGYRAAELTNHDPTYA